MKNLASFCKKNKTKKQKPKKKPRNKQRRGGAAALKACALSDSDGVKSAVPRETGDLETVERSWRPRVRALLAPLQQQREALS